MPNLHYLIGDATDPIIKPAIICHVNNDIGGWGRGFVIAVSKRNKAPEEAYKKWHQDKISHGVLFELGAVQLIKYSDQVIVANMIAQRDTRWDGKIPPIRYDALRKCLTSVYWWAKGKEYTVHMPRIGAVLAGGDWPTIENIILETMSVETYVYTIEEQKDRWPTNYETL